MVGVRNLERLRYGGRAIWKITVRQGVADKMVERREYLRSIEISVSYRRKIVCLKDDVSQAGCDRTTLYPNR